ncbi:MAG TPA: 2'-5' RNA ligase family protein [Holophaga sp.]|nr:2'-5' RNA ligase family protein [Holophaga sp.]
MSTLALQLHEPAAGNVRRLWDRLENVLGLRGVRRVPFPHVTLFGFEGVSQPQVQDLLDERCDEASPLILGAVGLGLFLKPQPVLYMPVIRSPGLDALHRALWEGVADLQGHLFPLYGPERWIPHLTLAQFDLEPGRLLEAVAALMDEDLSLSFEVRYLALFDWIGPRYEPRERYPLRGRPAQVPGGAILKS